MSKINLAELVRRVEALERAVGIRPPGRDDWQRVVGMFAGSDFMKNVDEAGRKIRDADRARAKKKRR